MNAQSTTSLQIRGMSLLNALESENEKLHAENRKLSEEHGQLHQQLASLTAALKTSRQQTTDSKEAARLLLEQLTTTNALNKKLCAQLAAFQRYFSTQKQP